MKWFLILRVFGTVALTQGPFIDQSECERWKAWGIARAEHQVALGVPIPQYKGRTVTRADIELECEPNHNELVRP